MSTEQLKMKARNNFISIVSKIINFIGIKQESIWLVHWNYKTLLKDIMEDLNKMERDPMFVDWKT